MRNCWQDIIAKRAKPNKEIETIENENLEAGNNEYKKDNLNLPIIYQGLITCKSCGGAVTASRVKKQQKNGNKHQYIYYHYSKRKDKNCKQKSYPLNQKDLEPQVLKFLKEITIVPEVYDWAMAQAKAKKDNDQDLKDKILATHKDNLARANNKIQNLIDMLADKDISREEYAERRKKCEAEITKAEEEIFKIEDKIRKQKERITDTYELMTNLQKKFKKGSPAVKKDYILKLGSNLSLEDKKLVIMPDLKIMPFQKHARGANKEIQRFEPVNIGEDYRKASSCEPAYSTWSG